MGWRVGWWGGWPPHLASPPGELTGFSPRIDWIFSTATLKRYLMGLGLGFGAETLGLGLAQLGFRVQSQGCGSATRFRNCCTKRKMKKNLLSPGHVAARRSRRYKTGPNTEFVFCRLYEMKVHASDSNMDSWFLSMHRPFFLALQRQTEPYFDTGCFPAQLLALLREISTTR